MFEGCGCSAAAMATAYLGRGFWILFLPLPLPFPTLLHFNVDCIWSGSLRKLISTYDVKVKMWIPSFAAWGKEGLESTVRIKKCFSVWQNCCFLAETCRQSGSADQAASPARPHRCQRRLGRSSRLRQEAHRPRVHRECHSLDLIITLVVWLGNILRRKLPLHTLNWKLRMIPCSAYLINLW